jgi:hypothetical protein
MGGYIAERGHPLEGRRWKDLLVDRPIDVSAKNGHLWPVLVRDALGGDFVSGFKRCPAFVPKTHRLPASFVFATRGLDHQDNVVLDVLHDALRRRLFGHPGPLEALEGAQVYLRDWAGPDDPDASRVRHEVSWAHAASGTVDLIEYV